jgi:hypothetical protein
MRGGYFATPVLKNLAEHRIDEISEEEKSAVVSQFFDLRSKIKSNDWLVNMLCQYDQIDQLTISDSFYYSMIKKMVFEDSLFLRLIPLKSWAFRDANFTHNMKNLLDAGIDVYEKGGTLTCDAEFSCKDLPMKMVTQYDHQVTEDTPQIIASFTGAVEFGTQSMAKSAFNLFSGIPLLRVPYEIDNLQPCACIFYNTKPYVPDLNF